MNSLELQGVLYEMDNQIQMVNQKKAQVAAVWKAKKESEAEYDKAATEVQEVVNEVKEEVVEEAQAEEAKV